MLAKATFFPTHFHDNDGRDLSVEQQEVRKLLFDLFDGWTLIGYFEARSACKMERKPSTKVRLTWLWRKRVELVSWKKCFARSKRGRRKKRSILKFNAA